jgi:hypothetical protein
MNETEKNELILDAFGYFFNFTQKIKERLEICDEAIAENKLSDIIDQINLLHIEVEEEEAFITRTIDKHTF